ncbi:uncharacterized protein LOC143199872 [Rhynchophorus ferrugineus]|uniref:uncharacterized protein LOC143199872 n=1 Tax=Rhynchophorus ferrugineus TaxID=354439 RepID=UPI003FCC63E3
MWYKLQKALLVFVIVLISLTNCFFLNNVNDLRSIPDKQTGISYESRKRKKKFRTLTTWILGALLVKMIIFPIAVKAMAVMATISVLLSGMSWITSAIVGFIKLARRPPHFDHHDVHYVHGHDVWEKNDRS